MCIMCVQESLESRRKCQSLWNLSYSLLLLLLSLLLLYTNGTQAICKSSVTFFFLNKLEFNKSETILSTWHCIWASVQTDSF
jgi:ABC-type phosphate transport system permease subunit